MDDKIFAQMIVQGDVVAFDALSRAHRLRLVRYLVERVRVRELAEDLAQETFVKAWKNLKRFDQVAYIRFASVYESFKDAHEFRRELNKLLKTRKQKNKKTRKQ